VGGTAGRRFAGGGAYAASMSDHEQQEPTAHEQRPEAPGLSLAPEPMEESEVQAQLDDIDVDAPRVGIVMGSKSDMEAMEKAGKELEDRGILHEVRVMSAHREPDVVADYAKNAHMRGLRVIIAGAGISAALPGAVAAHRPAGDRRAAVRQADRRRRPRRDPLDRADAAGRAGRVRRTGQPAQRRDPRRADPRGMTAAA
jgi:hypothetical protein